MASNSQAPKKEILLPSERKMDFKERWAYTRHEMKRNWLCYAMLAPFMLLFLVFTVIPVIMSLPIGFTSFDMAHCPNQNHYHLRYLHRTAQLFPELPAGMAHQRASSRAENALYAGVLRSFNGGQHLLRMAAHIQR